MTNLRYEAITVSVSLVSKLVNKVSFQIPLKKVMIALQVQTEQTRVYLMGHMTIRCPHLLNPPLPRARPEQWKVWNICSLETCMRWF